MVFGPPQLRIPGRTQFGENVVEHRIVAGQGLAGLQAREFAGVQGLQELKISVGELDLILALEVVSHPEIQLGEGVGAQDPGVA